jgi:TonB family protein
MLSFVVSETGEVEEPMIEDSSGVEAFEQAALDAIRTWRYTPATVDGKPVAQSMVKTTIFFALEGPAIGATRQFESTYRKIRQLLDTGDYAAAEPLLAELEARGRHNLYEDALFWALKYGYPEGVQSADASAKRRALELAFGLPSRCVFTAGYSRCRGTAPVRVTGAGVRFQCCAKHESSACATRRMPRNRGSTDRSAAHAPRSLDRA